LITHLMGVRISTNEWSKRLQLPQLDEKLKTHAGIITGSPVHSKRSTSVTDRVRSGVCPCWSDLGTKVSASCIYIEAYDLDDMLVIIVDVLIATERSKSASQQEHQS
jgi:hypothetical protein